jgi:hypothetical protein
MKQKLLFVLLLSFPIICLNAQNHNSSKPVLCSSDVENFMANIKLIEKEFNTLEIDYHIETDYQAFVQSFKTNKEANDIVKKYGYKNIEEFVQKVWAISACYATITIETKGMPDLKSAYRKIDEDESLSPEEKEKAKQQVKHVIETLSSSFLAAANDNDKATVRPYVARLDAFFQKNLIENEDE